ncbi:hypothetical protein JCM1840_001084 [Sporobolomyces johnsonii]
MPSPHRKLNPPLITDFTGPLPNTDYLYPPSEIYHDPPSSRLPPVRVPSNTAKLAKPATKPKARRVPSSCIKTTPAEIHSSQVDELESDDPPPLVRPTASKVEGKGKQIQGTYAAAPTARITMPAFAPSTAPPIRHSAAEHRSSTTSALERFRFRGPSVVGGVPCPSSDVHPKAAVPQKRSRPSKDLSEPPKAGVTEYLPDLERSPKRCAINPKKPAVQPESDPERYVYFMPDVDEDGNPIEASSAACDVSPQIESPPPFSSSIELPPDLAKRLRQPAPEAERSDPDGVTMQVDENPFQREQRPPTKHSLIHHEPGLSQPLRPPPLTFEEQQQVEDLLEGLADDLPDDDFELSGDEKLEEGAGEKRDLETVEQLLEPDVNDHFNAPASQPAVDEADPSPGPAASIQSSVHSWQHNDDLDIPAMPEHLSPPFGSSPFPVDVGASHPVPQGLGGIKPRSQANSPSSVSVTSTSTAQHAPLQRPIGALFGAAPSGLRRSDGQAPSATPRPPPSYRLVPLTVEGLTTHLRALVSASRSAASTSLDSEPSAEATWLRSEVTRLTNELTARDKKLGEMSEELRREAKEKEEMKRKIAEGEENEKDWNEERERWRMRVDALKEVRRGLLDRLKEIEDELEGIATAEAA